MNNSLQFIELFNEIDKYVRKIVNLDERLGFGKVVTIAAEKNATVKVYRQKLIEYNKLRNVIVHTFDGNKVVAEPNDFALAEWKMICDRVMKPKQILEVFNHKVVSLEENDTLYKALKIMKENDYSQLPIYNDGKFKGVLNGEHLSIWLRNLVDSSEINVKSHLIKDVISSEELIYKTEFLKEKDTLSCVMEIFKSFSTTENKLNCIIVTKKGASDETPLTILTEADIPVILEYI